MYVNDKNAKCYRPMDGPTNRQPTKRYTVMWVGTVTRKPPIIAEKDKLYGPTDKPTKDQPTDQPTDIGESRARD